MVHRTRRKGRSKRRSIRRSKRSSMRKDRSMRKERSRAKVKKTKVKRVKLKSKTKRRMNKTNKQKGGWEKPKIVNDTAVFKNQGKLWCIPNTSVGANKIYYNDGSLNIGTRVWESLSDEGDWVRSMMPVARNKEQYKNWLLLKQALQRKLDAIESDFNLYKNRFKVDASPGGDRWKQLDMDAISQNVEDFNGNKALSGDTFFKDKITGCICKVDEKYDGIGWAVTAGVPQLFLDNWHEGDPDLTEQLTSLKTSVVDTGHTWGSKMFSKKEKPNGARTKVTVPVDMKVINPMSSDKAAA